MTKPEGQFMMENREKYFNLNPQKHTTVAGRNAANHLGV